MLRVARPGGLVFISYTAWWSPHGGHETAPWHYLGGELAARRYRGSTGTRRRTASDEPLYAAHVGEGMALGASTARRRRRRRRPALPPAVGHRRSSDVPGAARGADLEPPPGPASPMTDARPPGPAPARGGPPPRVGGGVVRPRRADLRGHQERPLRRPVGLPRAGGPPLGPPGDVGRAAEPGLRLPLPDGSVLRRARRGRAGLGHAAPVVGGPPHGGAPHRPRPARRARGPRRHGPGARARSPTR